MHNPVNEALRHGLDSLADSVADAKPRLRGWLHLATAPLTLAAGIVLVALSPDTTTRWGSAIFSLSALVLFTVSAIYHRGTWSPRVWAFLRRFDHSNIFLLIAGSYTPFALILLEGTQRTVLLATVWTGASSACCSASSGPTRPAGSTCRSTSRWAGRRSSSSPASSHGAAAPRHADGDRGPGARRGRRRPLHARGVVYGFQRPDPWPRRFGFHEVFHTFTILAFATHYVAVSLATYSLR